MSRERSVSLVIDYVALAALFAVAVAGAVMLAVGSTGTGVVLVVAGVVGVLVKANLIRLKRSASSRRGSYSPSSP